MVGRWAAASACDASFGFGSRGAGDEAQATGNADEQIAQVQKRMQANYDEWPEAQWVDELRGIGNGDGRVVAGAHRADPAGSTADSLIAYAGLCPGLHQSDGPVITADRRRGDRRAPALLLIEATQCCADPSLPPAYERVMKARGKKVARLALARMVLRSIHKMLTGRSVQSSAQEGTRRDGCGGLMRNRRSRQAEAVTTKRRKKRTSES